MVFNRPRLIGTAVSCFFLFFVRIAAAQQTVQVPKGTDLVMIDGKLGKNEWKGAATLPLGNLASVHVKHSADYVWIAVECLTCTDFALDLYVQPEDGEIYDLHSSAKLGERQLRDGNWSDQWEWWNNNAWVANWSRVDSFQDKTFVNQQVREFQISRERFDGSTWRVMFELLLPDEPKWRTIRYPQKAINNVTKDWIVLRFQ